jgi:hypothetical protein
MMIMGFGFIGAILRRRRRLAKQAAEGTSGWTEQPSTAAALQRG